MRIVLRSVSLLISVIYCIGCLSSAVVVNGEGDIAKMNLSAESAALILCNTEGMIFSKNASKRLPMASTTKIMTAVIAIENSDLDAMVEVHPDAVGIEGSSAYLAEGELLSMRELLYALLLQSANDAAVAIAFSVGGDVSGFSELMNEKASSLGLDNTHFENPHGLDAETHFTTAEDLARLTSYAMKNEAFREIVSTERFTTESGKVFVNHNKLLDRYDGAVGVKTGFTKRSGRCLVSAAERDGVLAVAVTLNASDDWNDHKKLLDYCFDAYENVTLAEAHKISIDLPCISGVSSTVRCSNVERLRLCLPKGTVFTITIEADRYYPAPVRTGDALATAKFYSEGELLASLPLFAEKDVNEKTGELSLLDRILRFLGR